MKKRSMTKEEREAMGAFEDEVSVLGSIHDIADIVKKSEETSKRDTSKEEQAAGNEKDG